MSCFSPSSPSWALGSVHPVQHRVRIHPTNSNAKRIRNHVPRCRKGDIRHPRLFNISASSSDTGADRAPVTFEWPGEEALEPIATLLGPFHRSVDFVRIEGFVVPRYVPRPECHKPTQYFTTQITRGQSLRKQQHRLFPTVNELGIGPNERHTGHGPLLQACPWRPRSGRSLTRCTRDELSLHPRTHPFPESRLLRTVLDEIDTVECKSSEYPEKVVEIGYLVAGRKLSLHSLATACISILSKPRVILSIKGYIEGTQQPRLETSSAPQSERAFHTASSSTSGRSIVLGRGRRATLQGSRFRGRDSGLDQGAFMR